MFNTDYLGSEILAAGLGLGTIPQPLPPAARTEETLPPISLSVVPQSSVSTPAPLPPEQGTQVDVSA